MLEKVYVSETIIDGVRIITYTDGSQHFEIDNKDEQKEECTKDNGFWGRIKNWIKKHEFKPYIKSRDLSDPFCDRKNNIDDIDVGQDGKSCIETGINISF